MQREMQLLYTENEVNPLAGCLPALVQIPVFIGLYRALLKLATDDLLNEPFLWLPNLEGYGFAELFCKLECAGLVTAALTFASHAFFPAPQARLRSAEC